MKIEECENYKQIQETETISAILDKMCLEEKFVSELLTSSLPIKDILKKNGFILDGECFEIFEKNMGLMRTDFLQILSDEKSR